MSNHSLTFATGAPTAARSSSAVYAAVAAVAIFSGSLVTLQLSASPSAGAATVAAAPSAPIVQTAKTWDLEPRWWGGNVQHVEQPAAPSTTPAPTRTAVAESDLTFARGYLQRVAARQVAMAEQIEALASSAETMPETPAARPAAIARNTVTSAHANAAPATRSLTVPHVDASTERAAPSDVAGQTLAFDEPRGFGAPHATLFPNIFGTLR